MKRIISSGLVIFAIALAGPAIAKGQNDTTKIINGGILNSRAVNLPKPEYPEEARRSGLEGTVAVRVVIDEDGNVISADASAEGTESANRGKDGTIVPASDPILRKSAERSALDAKFVPTRLNGVPVRESGTIVYRFVNGKYAASAKGVLNGGIINGKAVSLPMPEYPDAAKAANAKGTVAVQVTIDEGGSVIAAQAVSGHPLLRSAAVEAARQAVFSPTFLSGRPVKVSGIVLYNFVP
jgi:TonB family protein